MENDVVQNLARTPEPPRAFDDVRALPPHLVITPLAWVIGISATLAAGVAAALFPSEAFGQQALRSASAASGALYAVISYIDFREHFHMEKALTGRYLAWRVVPPGETLNHMGSGLTLIALLLLARPIGAAADARDVVVLMLPVVFLLLGLRDEFVFHRRRAHHREDMMHTTAHLAGGALIASYLALRLVDWSG